MTRVSAFNISLSACRQRITQFHLIRRQMPKATPLTLDVAIQQHRHTRTITSGAVKALIGIANQQFQLDRSRDDATAPLPVRGGHLFHGLRDALVRLDAAGSHALAAKSEQARTGMYMEVFLLREQAQAAVRRWEANLARGMATDDRALVIRSQAWLDNGDAEAIACVEGSFAFLEEDVEVPAPKTRMTLDAQAVALMKP